jgi:hypothetical protein
MLSPFLISEKKILLHVDTYLDNYKIFFSCAYKAICYFIGAFGYFEVTHDITQYTKAVVFSDVGKKTPIAVRFSFVTGETGSADTTRYIM